MTDSRNSNAPTGSISNRSSSIAFQRPIVIGTRGSALARWQTDYVLGRLKELEPDLTVEVRVIKTSGDKDQVRPLAELGGLGVFTKEIESALLSREIDLAVHSLKDLPTDNAPGLLIAAMPPREDPRDCIVSRHGAGLMDLPASSRVGTSSARRTAQVLALRPDVQVVPLRGNVDTRMRKAQSEGYDAVVLAAAGLTRLGRAGEITEYLPLDRVLPDPGQGALAIQIRADDAPLLSLVSRLDDPATHAAVSAERSFLRALGGGCRTPMGAYAERREDQLVLTGLVGSLDGAKMVRGEIAGPEDRAEELGAELARRLLHEGAAEILGASAPERYGEADSQVAPPQPLLPLQARRIVITRAQSQANALAEKVRALGGEPIEFPTIEFAALEDFRGLDAALDHASDFDWVVFTSANGVRAVSERLNCQGRGFEQFGTNRIAAIGPATAAALEQLGVQVDFIPTKFLGTQIAHELPVRPGERALLLRADIASEELGRGLTARGVNVTDVDSYRTVLPQPPQCDFGDADAITFTSSSTVRNFLALRSGDTGLDRMAVFCIGPVTAQTARELGLRVDAVATEHTVDGLVATITRYYQEAPPPLLRSPEGNGENKVRR